MHLEAQYEAEDKDHDSKLAECIEDKNKFPSCRLEVIVKVVDVNSIRSHT